MIEYSKVLLVSDYDRTMTGFDGSIPADNLEAVEEFMARGGAFTIATGRSRPMFLGPMEGLQVNAPVILANGGALWDPESDRITVLHPLEEEDLAVVREIVTGHGGRVWAENDGGLKIIMEFPCDDQKEKGERS